MAPSPPFAHRSATAHLTLRAFASFLISDEIQSLIGIYGVEQFGQQLFTPDADKKDSELGLD